MSNTSWDIITVINTTIVNQQLVNQLNNTAINFNQTSSDLSGDQAALTATISGIELLEGSSGQNLVLGITLNGSITFTTVTNSAFSYQINGLVLPIQCAINSYSSSASTTVNLPFSSAVLAVNQLNTSAVVSALVAQGAAPPSNEGLVQAVANVVATGLQQMTTVGAQIAQVSNLTVSNAEASVQQIGCAVQPVTNGAVLYLMLSYSGSTPLAVDVNASLAASLSAQNQAVVYFSQDFFMGTILGNGTLPNGQGFTYTSSNASLNLGNPLSLSGGGSLQQFTWQAIGNGINVSANAVWSSGSGALNVTITNSLIAHLPVIQGNVVVLEPNGTPSTNQNIDQGWLIEILDIASMFGGVCRVS